MTSFRADRPYGSFPKSRGEEPSLTPPPPRKPGLRERLARLPARTRSAQLVGLAILVALSAALLTTALTQRPQLTSHDVDDAIQQALASATPKPPAAVGVFEQILPSVVQIRTQGRITGGETERGIGAGVVADELGDVLTALHVVDGAEDITVLFADGSRSRAQIVARRPESDIAVVRLTEPPPQLVPAVLGDPRALRVGDEAIVVGNPFGLRYSLSAGTISGLERSFQPPNQDRSLSGLIQIDAAVNPGNSGGPLLNREGDVVGIVVGLVNPTQQTFFVGIGFAVPIDVAGGALGIPPD